LVAWLRWPATGEAHEVRKYYALTRRGAVALGEVREKTAELVGEVLEDRLVRRRRTVRTASPRTTRTRRDSGRGLEGRGTR
jgi:DNA-binding PadR family transcriptional regulator